MSKSPSRFDMNASRLASGDHAGLRSLAGWLVRGVCCDPSALIVKSSKLPTRSELKATRPLAPGRLPAPKAPIDLRDEFHEWTARCKDSSSSSRSHDHLGRRNRACAQTRLDGRQVGASLVEQERQQLKRAVDAGLGLLAELALTGVEVEP